MPRTGNLPTQPRGRAEHWKRNRLVLRIYIALAMFNIASSCPRTVSMGGVWPDGAPMDRLESSDGTARCCMFPWVDASTFGTAEELSGQNVNLAVDTVVCTSSKTLEEFAAAFLSGE